MEPGINQIKMRKSTKVILIILSSLLAVGLIYFGQLEKDRPDISGIEPAVSFHRAEPYDKNFYDTVYSFVKKDFSLEGKEVLAGIVPHHLLAGDMIAEFYDNLAGLEYSTIILLGPNHYNAGQSLLISSNYDWQTPYGRLECDEEFLDELRLIFKEMGNEPEVVDKEHSINSQAGFIKKTFPQAKFVPLILSPNMDAEKSGVLAEALASLGEDRKILLIASVDFSHYKDSRTAIAHDQAGIEAIKKKDYENIYALDIDSPPSIYTLIKYSELKGAGFKLLDNSNSALLAGKPELESTTSYVTGYFLKGEIRMLFFGDLMLDRYVKSRISENGFDYLFEEIGDVNFFDDYDIVSANLEGAITGEGEHYAPVMSYDFAFTPEHINNLKRYNFNFFTLANNHISDQGERGINETRNNLEAMGFAYVGCPDGVADSCSVKTLNINDKVIGLVAFSQVYSELDEVKVVNLIADLNNLSDAIIANIHWGVEYEKENNIAQRNLAHTMIDAGADIIIGHHPHVIQGVEIYNNKPIFYSLGNFIFDQYFSEETQEGLALELNLGEDETSIILHPLKSSLSQIQLINNDEKKGIFEEIIKYSTLDDFYEEQIRKGKLRLKAIF
jgi:poly-gamma-glutamate synthesis protein (capsule biosynthesis protein)